MEKRIELEKRGRQADEVSFDDARAVQAVQGRPGSDSAQAACDGSAAIGVTRWGSHVVGIPARASRDPAPPHPISVLICTDLNAAVNF
jgi:hypothetical protein